MRRIAGALAVSVVAVAGCSGSSDDSKALDTCVEALDAADQGFSELSANVRVVQQALREAFDGNLSSAQATLDRVTRADPSRYKQLEADCRAAAR